MAYTTIDDPTQYFDTTLWTGSGGARTISGLNHKPDLIWTKTRSVGYNHMWSDSSRGFNANSELGSNSTAAEGGLSAETYGYKSGHTADGWTMVDGTDSVDNQEDGNTNQPSVTYVGWTWAANGGTTSSNTDGSITSAVQASTTSGFSIVTYTGNGSDNATVGHGLGEKPKVIIPKRRDSTGNWLINNWVSEQDYAQKLKWNDTEAQTSSDSFVKDAGSSTFTLGTDADVNASSGTYVAYCFAEKQGFSKFGQYTGNGSTNGPFLYTGFTPNFFFVKRWDGTASWHLYDGEREKFNDGSRLAFKINTSETEFSKNVDFLSNGIKFRDTTSDANTAGGAYIWGAFARHPFVSSKGVPVTAV